MIYSLTGILKENSADYAVIDVNGVGFFVNIPTSVSGYLPRVGQQTTLYTYMAVKEDAMDLYGFADRASQSCFKTLISVSGVGPKAGLAILSVMNAQNVAMAVASGDYKPFTAASGVGPKVAQRIVLELKGKFAGELIAGGTDSRGAGDFAGGAGSVSRAISALVALGYNQSRAALAVSKTDTSRDVQTVIKQALKLLAGGKV